MKASEILRKAKGLIDSPEKWIVKLTTRQISAAHCDETAPRCAGIALWNARVKVYMLFCEANSIQMGGVPEWNDAPGRTHSEVMTAFDRAIALAEADERSN